MATPVDVLLFVSASCLAFAVAVGVVQFLASAVGEWWRTTSLRGSKHVCDQDQGYVCDHGVTVPETQAERMAKRFKAAQFAHWPPRTPRRWPGSWA